MKKILMTGAAGRLGRHLRHSLKDAYLLRLSDRAPLAVEGEGEEINNTDLADLDAVKAAMTGVDAVIHLGGISGEAEWPSIVESNITGTYNVFEAARAAGVKRVVYASSNHAIGFYPRSATIDHTAHSLPDSRYGVSKAVGESLAALYAYKHGVQSLCIRIGNFNEKPLEQRHLSIWVSPRDLDQLVRIGLEHPGIHHEIVYGVSANTRSWWDNRNATRLGYVPLDNAETFAAGVKDDNPAGNAAQAVCREFQGGRYCM